MKIKAAWIWTGGRILLAAVLLAVIFKYGITIRDTVYLVDGTKYSGTVVEWNASHVKIERNGEIRTFAISQIAMQGEEPHAKPHVKRGLISILKQMTAGKYVVGLVMLGFIPFIAAMRWKLLVEAQGIRIGFWRAVELTYVGLFFNNVVPGLTGGDVVKAYYAAKLTSTRKTNAVVTVFLDRLVGLVILGVVAAVAVCASVLSPVKTHGQGFTRASYFVGAFVFCSVAGGVGFYSKRVRGLVQDALRILPGYGRVRSTRAAQRVVAFLRRIDSAVYLYRYKKRVLVYAALISALAHSVAVTAIYFFGQALQVQEARLLSCFAIVPMCFVISSIPLTPAGWGVGEVVFKELFGVVGVAATAAVTMSVIYRLTQAVWTLPGGVILMFQRERPAIEELEHEMEGGLLSGENAVERD